VARGFPWARRKRREHESDLAFRLSSKLGGGLSRGAEKHFFEFFGKFAADADSGGRGKDFGEGKESTGEAMRGFEVDGGVVAGGGSGELILAAA
jgi:hypothetical protein